MVKDLTFVEASLCQGLDVWIQINSILFSEEGDCYSKECHSPTQRCRDGNPHVADVLEHRFSSWTSRLVEGSQAGVIARCGHRLDFCSILPSTFIQVRGKRNWNQKSQTFVLTLSSTWLKAMRMIPRIELFFFFLFFWVCGRSDSRFSLPALLAYCKE